MAARGEKVQPLPDGTWPPVDNDWREAPENDAWVRELWTKWDRPGEPAPCDCGYFKPDRLVLCDAKDRQRCHVDPQARLRRHYAEHNQKVVRDRRAWPGAPFPKAGCGTCHWCNRAIVHGRVKSRMWHDGRLDEPDCKYENLLRIDRDMQVHFLLDRDGKRCAGCSQIVGGWANRPVTLQVLETWRAWGPSWRKRYPVDVWVGDYTSVNWCTPMQVDHIVALGLVAHLDDETRRLFFGPVNLNLLCDGCHKIKTADDTRAIRILQAHIANGGDPEALRELWAWVIDGANEDLAKDRV